MPPNLLPLTHVDSPVPSWRLPLPATAPTCHALSAAGGKSQLLVSAGGGGKRTVVASGAPPAAPHGRRVGCPQRGATQGGPLAGGTRKTAGLAFPMGGFHVSLQHLVAPHHLTPSNYHLCCSQGWVGVQRP